VLVYLTIHLYFVEKLEFKIHHILFIFVIFWYLMCPDIAEPVKNELYIFALAEISNIFLSIRNMLKDPSILQFVSIPAFIHPINDGLFAMTFFYARIYLYFKYIITNQDFFENIIKYNKFFMCDKIVIAIIYGLFILNLYWFGLILSNIIKLLKIDKLIVGQLTNKDDTLFFLKIEEIRSSFKMAHHQ